MLKSSVQAVLKNIVAFSVHGQILWDVYFAETGASEATRMSRIGPESVDEGLKPGDRITVESLFGVVTRIRRADD